MIAGYDSKCAHGNTARYCDLCEVEALREERLRLYDKMDRLKRWAIFAAACATISFIFNLMGLLIRP